MLRLTAVSVALLAGLLLACSGDDSNHSGKMDHSKDSTMPSAMGSHSAEGTTAKLPDQPVRIIGVVENKPLHFVGMGATSNVYIMGKDLYYVLVRVSGDDIPGAITAIRGLWQRMAGPGNYFYYDFVDQLFAENYELFGRVNLVFAGLALFAFVIRRMAA